MTGWAARLNDHPLQRSIKQLNAVAGELSLSVDGTGRESVVRLRSLCERLDGWLGNANPQWVTPRLMDALHAAVQAAVDAAIDWRDRPGDDALAVLDGAVDTVADVPLGWQATVVDTDLLTQLRQAGQDRAAEFDAFIDDQRAIVERAAQRLSGEVENTGNQHLTRMNELAERAEQVREQLELHQSQAAQIVGTVAATGLSGGFKAYAEHQRRSADRWRLTSVAAASLAAVAAAAAFLVFRDEQFSWDALVSKIAIIALLAAIAAYAGRESSAHRLREIAARRLELELTAIDPYLASLDETRRAAVKEQMAHRIFGQPAADGTADPGPVPVLTPELRERIQELVGVLEGLLKR
jgi:hypothetical protein